MGKKNTNGVVKFVFPSVVRSHKIYHRKVDTITSENGKGDSHKALVKIYKIRMEIDPYISKEKAGRNAVPNDIKLVFPFETKRIEIFFNDVEFVALRSIIVEGKEIPMYVDVYAQQ